MSASRFLHSTGVCVKTFTGHRDLVTNLDFQKIVIPSSSLLTMDAIASVSDDGTIKVFLIDASSFMG